MSSVCIYSWHMPCLFAKLFHRHNCPILLMVKNKVFYWNCIFTFSFTLTQVLLVVVMTHTLSLYSKLLWLVKSVVLLAFMLQLLFHLLSAIPRDKLPASLCCETSSRGYLESALLNALTFFYLYSNILVSREYLE